MRSAPSDYGLAAVEVCLQCIVFGLGDPKTVGGFHSDLHGGVFAAENFVGRLQVPASPSPLDALVGPSTAIRLMRSLAKLGEVYF